jgi:hypothetical protein
VAIFEGHAKRINDLYALVSNSGGLAVERRLINRVELNRRSVSAGGFAGSGGGPTD